MFLHILRAVFILSLAGVAMSFLATESESVGAQKGIFAWMQFNKEYILLVSLMIGVAVVVVDVFIPQKSLGVISGVLFGLMYAWYLNNSYGGVMQYEMSLLHWPARSLIPHQAKERFRKQVLVEFFREEVFGHKPG